MDKLKTNPSKKDLNIYVQMRHKILYKLCTGYRFFFLLISSSLISLISESDEKLRMDI